MAKAYAPTLRSGVRGFSSVGLLLQFIYRLRSPFLGRLWTLMAHACAWVVCDDMAAQLARASKDGGFRKACKATDAQWHTLQRHACAQAHALHGFWSDTKA